MLPLFWNFFCDLSNLILNWKWFEVKKDLAIYRLVQQLLHFRYILPFNTPFYCCLQIAFNGNLHCKIKFSNITINRREQIYWKCIDFNTFAFVAWIFDISFYKHERKKWKELWNKTISVYNFRDFPYWVIFIHLKHKSKKIHN